MMKKNIGTLNELPLNKNGYVESLNCTGNLRSFSEQLFFAITKKDSNYLKKCQKYLSIIMIFMMGVIIGDIATVRLWQYACIIPSVILVIVIILMNKENIA